MPKRDAAFMEAQRSMIARAALGVLLEKGYHATSLRDICKAAGISIGALYTHFKTKEEAVVVACSQEMSGVDSDATVSSWEDYVDLVFAKEADWENEIVRGRLRLSLQFATEVMQLPENPPGLSNIQRQYRETIYRCLAKLHEAGIIKPTIDLAALTKIHIQIVSGASFGLLSDHDRQFSEVRETVKTALELTAGFVGSARKRASKTGGEEKSQPPG